MRLLALLPLIAALSLLAATVPAHADGLEVLYATHTDTLSLQASYELWTDGDWAAYADVFWAPAAESVGAGLSVRPPADLPVVRQIVAVTGASRIGAGLHHADAWEGTVYIVYDVLRW